MLSFIAYFLLSFSLLATFLDPLAQFEVLSLSLFAFNTLALFLFANLVLMSLFLIRTTLFKMITKTRSGGPRFKLAGGPSWGPFGEKPTFEDELLEALENSPFADKLSDASTAGIEGRIPDFTTMGELTRTINSCLKAQNTVEAFVQMLPADRVTIEALLSILNMQRSAIPTEQFQVAHYIIKHIAVPSGNYEVEPILQTVGCYPFSYFVIIVALIVVFIALFYILRPSLKLPASLSITLVAEKKILADIVNHLPNSYPTFKADCLKKIETGEGLHLSDFYTALGHMADAREIVRQIIEKLPVSGVKVDKKILHEYADHLFASGRVNRPDDWIADCHTLINMLEFPGHAPNTFLMPEYVIFLEFYWPPVLASFIVLLAASLSLYAAYKNGGEKAVLFGELIKQKSVTPVILTTFIAFLFGFGHALGTKHGTSATPQSSYDPVHMGDLLSPVSFSMELPFNNVLDTLPEWAPIAIFLTVGIIGGTLVMAGIYMNDSENGRESGPAFFAYMTLMGAGYYVVGCRWGLAAILGVATPFALYAAMVGVGLAYMKVRGDHLARLKNYAALVTERDTLEAVALCVKDMTAGDRNEAKTALDNAACDFNEQEFAKTLKRNKLQLEMNIVAFERAHQGSFAKNLPLA